MSGGRALGVVMAAGAVACAGGTWAELSAAPSRHAGEASAALRRGDADAALAAARAAVRADPGDTGAQHALAYAATLEAGAPTREALGALTAAYEAAPFASAEVMAWRVDLADAYWTGMPDPLAASTLSQIDALGRMGDDWRPRVRWCRSAVTEAIAAAACATVPGVEQGADLKREVSGAMPDAP